MSDIEVGTYLVEAPSGATFSVLTEEEVAYFRDRSALYTTQNHFINISDFQDLDRVLIMELMCWRWGLWLSQEKDYFGLEVDLDALKKALFDWSKELRLLKKSLGIDKPARDREKGESFSDYLETLRQRAKEFGVMREGQLTKCITLFQELKALITLMNNCTPEEQREMNIEMHDIFQWVQEIAIPEFDIIDLHFQQNQQKYWLKDI